MVLGTATTWSASAVLESRNVELVFTTAGRYTILRSLTHSDTVHTTAGYSILTGVPHPRANSPGGASSIRPGPEDHPHLGSLVARLGPTRPGQPPFVALPEVIRDAGVNE